MIHNNDPAYIVTLVLNCFDILQGHKYIFRNIALKFHFFVGFEIMIIEIGTKSCVLLFMFIYYLTTSGGKIYLNYVE